MPPISRRWSSTSKDPSRWWLSGVAARPTRMDCGPRPRAPTSRTASWSPASRANPIRRRPPASGRPWTGRRPPTSAATSPARRPSRERTSSPGCSNRAPEARGLLAAEHGRTPLALGGQSLARVRAGLHAVEELLQVVAPVGAPLLGHALHERLHGADREGRVVRDLTRQLP